MQNVDAVRRSSPPRCVLVPVLTGVQIISLLRQEDPSGEFSTFHVRRCARSVSGFACYY